MAAELVYRLAVLVDGRRFLGVGDAPSRTLRFNSYARMKPFVRRSTLTSFRRLLGDVRRELMQRLSVVLHGTSLSSRCFAER
jgi:hypothetical protein